MSEEESKSEKIITDVKALPSISEMGRVETNLTQIPCQRTISAATFTKGNQQFQFEVSGNQRWSPSQSYFKLRVKLTDSAGNQPTLDDRLAFAENFVANLYTNVYAYIGNKDVSSMNSYVGQAGMLRHRLGRPKQWLDTIGKTAYYLDSNLSKRTASVSAQSIDVAKTEYNYIAADTVAIASATGIATFVSSTADATLEFVVGDSLYISGIAYVIQSITDATHVVVLPKPGSDIAATTDFTVIPVNADDQYIEGQNDIEVLFRPPIGLFHSDRVLPSGEYRIVLTPTSNLIGAVQSVVSKTYSTDYLVEVSEVDFYMHTFRAEAAADSIQYYLANNEYNIQQKLLASGSAQSRLSFQLPSSTIGIAVFMQDNVNGADTRNPPSLFNNLDKSADDLLHLQITYGGISKPSTDWDSQTTTLIQRATGRYIDTAMNTGLYEFGCESFEDWRRRGALYYYEWILPQDNHASNCQISAQFSNLATDTNLVVCAVYRQISKIVVKSGLVVDVLKKDI